MGFKYYMLVGLSSLFSVASIANGLPVTSANDISCEGPWLNDEIAERCQAEGATAQIFKTGTRYEYESFETVSKALTSEIEADYDMILMVNSADHGIAGTPRGAFIPNQHMLVLQKPSGQSKMFTRDRFGVINGLARGVKQLTDIIGTTPYQNVLDANAQHGANKNAGMPVEWDGMDVVPISSGKSGNGGIRAFSGLFQVNWERSDQMFDSSIYAPMSQEMYLGYFYHGRNLPRSQWTNGRRERVSYAAIHGTPPSKWNLLGVRRDSHGCGRVHPMIQKEIRRAAKSLPYKRIFELDWDYNLGEQDLVTPYDNSSPVLIMVFDSFDSAGV